MAADSELAAAMDVGTGAPLLLLEGRGTDQHGWPLEIFATWHRADQVAFDLDVSDQTPGQRCPESGRTSEDDGHAIG